MCAPLTVVFALMIAALRAAGNQKMIDEGKPTRALGFRLVGDSPGTDDMTCRLMKAGIPHTVTNATRSSADAAAGRED